MDSENEKPKEGGLTIEALKALIVGVANSGGRKKNERNYSPEERAIWKKRQMKEKARRKMAKKSRQINRGK
jgi:hypothetical protein